MKKKKYFINNSISLSIKLEGIEMKPSNFNQVKIPALLKKARSISFEKVSINVDTVKVYEIKDHPDPHVIDLGSFQKEKRRSQQLPQDNAEGKFHNDEKVRSQKPVQTNIKSGKQNNNERAFANGTLNLRLKLFDKVRKYIKHFASISESKVNLKITSEQIYNLIQFRKKLSNGVLDGISFLRFLYQVEYINHLSLLLYVIETKQRQYAIYEEFEEMEKIVNLIQSEIKDIEELYLIEETQKMSVIFCEEFLQKLENFKQSFKHQTKSDSIIIQNDEQQIKEKVQQRNFNQTDLYQENQLSVLYNETNPQEEISNFQQIKVSKQISVENDSIRAQNDKESIIHEQIIVEELSSKSENRNYIKKNQEKYDVQTKNISTSKLFTSLEEKVIYNLSLESNFIECEEIDNKLDEELDQAFENSFKEFSM